MVTKVIAGLVVVGLAVGVWWFWPREGPINPSSTTVLSAHATTTSSAGTTTTLPATTSTTELVSKSHVVETVEEAEEILRELWFGWFEGIYNQDEDRIREVVATEELLESARAAFGFEFQPPPSIKGVRLTGSEILRSTNDCLVVWSTIDISAFVGDQGQETSLYILRSVDDSWRIATVWVNRDDIWEPDCDSLLLPLP
jgi:hypothetical protein